MHPALIIMEVENIPKSRPCLILMNHYSRPSYIPFWLTFAISSALPMESRWLMTSAWTSPNKTWNLVKKNVTKIIFTAIARVYGFINMPPMPPDPRETTERALAVRKLLELARQRLPIAIGMAPEGRDYPHTVLGWPPSGTGRLLEQLNRYIEKFVPVGVYEENDQLVVNFGPPISLNDKYQNSDEKDIEISHHIMHSIACLLPERLRGEFK